MPYVIDRQLLRLAGDVLAGGSGRVTLADYQRLCRGATADDTVDRAEHAALLVVTAAVLDRCHPDAREKLLALVTLIRDSDPGMEPWVVRAVSGTLLRRGVALIAGRGAKRTVTLDELHGLISVAVSDSPGARSLARDESRALLVLFEMLHGRLSTDALDLAVRQTALITSAGVSIGSAATPATASGSSALGLRQCGACAGTGAITCGSCGGRGSQTYSRTRQRADGTIEYYQERIDCACNAGRLRCQGCGGTGRKAT